MTRRTALFTSRAFLPDGIAHLPLLYPLWGRPRGTPAPAADRWSRWESDAREHIDFVDDLQAADAAVLPFAWELARSPDAVAAAEALELECRRNGKTLLAFYVSDDASPVPLGAEILRTSLYRSTRAENEHAMPALTADVRAEGDLEDRPFAATPTVGFCGFAPGYGAGRAGTRLARRVRARARVAAGRVHPAATVRAAALRALERSDAVETRLVVRDAFWADMTVRDGRPDPELTARARAEFVTNMAESDYVLCARGGGNFSYRLYETMSAGRIPAFVDTDCVLPFEDIVDWGRLCVWIRADDVAHIGERIADFHASLDEATFAQLQRDCRDTWERLLSPHGFYANLGRFIPTEQ